MKKKESQTSEFLRTPSLSRNLLVLIKKSLLDNFPVSFFDDSEQMFGYGFLVRWLLREFEFTQLTWFKRFWILFDLLVGWII